MAVHTHHTSALRVNTLATADAAWLAATAPPRAPPCRTYWSQALLTACSIHVLTVLRLLLVYWQLLLCRISS
jgi:hypothetical protein